MWSTRTAGAGLQQECVDLQGILLISHAKKISYLNSHALCESGMLFLHVKFSFVMEEEGKETHSIAALCTLTFRFVVLSLG
jgi:hypothetical protein